MIFYPYKVYHVVINHHVYFQEIVAQLIWTVEGARKPLILETSVLEKLKPLLSNNIHYGPPHDGWFKVPNRGNREYRIQIFELLELEVSNDNVIRHAVTASTVSFKSQLCISLTYNCVPRIVFSSRLFVLISFVLRSSRKASIISFWNYEGNWIHVTMTLFASNFRPGGLLTTCSN